VNCVYFFPREKDGDNPAGVTVSKRANLPRGDFGVTEYSWGELSLWFVDAHKFTADEREAAYRAFVAMGERGDR